MRAFLFLLLTPGALTKECRHSSDAMNLSGRHKLAAAGFKPTLLRSKMKLEVAHTALEPAQPHR